jgi:hypothetical protein
MDVNLLLSADSARKMASQHGFSHPAVASALFDNTQSHQSIYPDYPASPKRKRVVFKLIVPDSDDSQARLPMVVMVSAHDTTDSIISTVRTFFGIYDGPNTVHGFSFEDQDGNTIISRYENFYDNMSVYVRVRPVSPEHSGRPIGSEEEAQAFIRNGGEIVGSDGTLMTSADISEVFSGASSPTTGRGRRSMSPRRTYLPGSRSQSRKRSSVNDDLMSGYTSSDSSSRRSKPELLASADISLDNIVEGNRRNRAKFDSSVSTCVKDFSPTNHLAIDYRPLTQLFSK